MTTWLTRDARGERAPSRRTYRRARASRLMGRASWACWARLTLAACASTLGAGGCATLTHGIGQTVAISTDPPGAQVAVNGAPPRGAGAATTPATLQLPRREDAVVTLTMPGYEAETFRLVSVVDGSVAEQLLKGGVVGGAVDLATGAAFRLVPDRLHVALKPRGMGTGAIAGAGGEALGGHGATIAGAGAAGAVGAAAATTRASGSSTSSRAGAPGDAFSYVSSGANDGALAGSAADVHAKRLLEAARRAPGGGASAGELLIGGAPGDSGFVGVLDTATRARLDAIDDLRARGLLTDDEHAVVRHLILARAALLAAGPGRGV